jgi:hypothetical protein
VHINAAITVPSDLGPDILLFLDGLEIQAISGKGTLRPGRHFRKNGRWPIEDDQNRIICVRHPASPAPLASARNRQSLGYQTIP